ncbi:unnamed protein product [Penicillium nalgiovense]|nr:unnamed protein product [Penicillium nalgiovense]
MRHWRLPTSVGTNITLKRSVSAFLCFQCSGVINVTVKFQRALLDAYHSMRQNYKWPWRTSSDPIHLDDQNGPSHFPIDRPVKRQCRVSQAPEDESKLENHPQQASNGTTIEPKVPVRTRGTLMAEFIKVVNLNDSLATPALKLLELYFCLWECYVVKSAQKIRLEEEQRQLQASNDLLASDSDILLQLCNVQASVLWERKRAVQALCNGVVSALEASDLQAYSVDEPEP